MRNRDFENLHKKWRSLPYLEKKCLHFFKKNNLAKPIFVSDLNFSIPFKKELNVVLWGDGILHLCNPAMWAFDIRYRFWVLSETNKELITRLVGIPQKHISVIPRNLLSAHKKTRPWPYDVDFTLVLSGRCSGGKNLLFALGFANHLQNLSLYKIKIAVCSPQINSKQIRSALSTYHWIDPPLFLGDLGTNWHLKINKFENPVFLNMSTAINEDFNVSLDQARSLGWPAILSNWSAFSEYSGNSVYKLDANQIFKFNRIRRTNDRSAESILKKAATDFLNTIQSAEKSPSRIRWPKEKKHTWKKPKSISGPDLIKISAQVSEKKYRNLQRLFLQPDIEKSNPTWKTIKEIMIHKHAFN